jgi:hypothetical protein
MEVWNEPANIKPEPSDFGLELFKPETSKNQAFQA